MTADKTYFFPYRSKVGFCRQSDYGFDTGSILENPWYLFLIIILGIIFILMFLGVLKGAIGICCSKYIGELGLGVLVDLPKPLEKYHEKELRHFPVKYDSTGWPVDPNTYKRTVRTLSKKAEFFLNVVFFLAYPLALSLQLCCCIKDENYVETEPTCYKTVNMVTMNERIKRKNNCYKCGQNLIYGDNGKKEEEDTKYVISQMRQSQISLQN